jgi:hypothetical protein
MEAQEKEHIKNKLCGWSGILARMGQAICGPWLAPSAKMGIDSSMSHRTAFFLKDK